MIRAWVGESAAAIAHARISIRLSPYDPLIYLPFVGLGHAHFFAGESTRSGKRSKQGFPSKPTVQRAMFSVDGSLDPTWPPRRGKIERQPFSRITSKLHS